MKTTIKDGAGRVVAYLVTEGSNERIEDSDGNLIGRYLSTADHTIDSSGRLVGRGNQLQRLIR
jgi:hypothetical protein